MGVMKQLAIMRDESMERGEDKNDVYLPSRPFRPDPSMVHQSQEFRRRIGSNEFTEETLSIVPGRFVEDGKAFYPHDGDWLATGRAIGNNVHVKYLDCSHWVLRPNDVSSNENEQFWRGVASSTSIERLDVEWFNLHGGVSFFGITSQFLKQLKEESWV